MIKMSYDKFEEICEKMDELPNIIDNNKGLTEHDLKIIQTKIAKDYSSMEYMNFIHIHRKYNSS